MMGGVGYLIDTVPVSSERFGTALLLLVWKQILVLHSAESYGEGLGFSIMVKKIDKKLNNTPCHTSSLHYNSPIATSRVRCSQLEASL